jgi:hypothetical protein
MTGLANCQRCDVLFLKEKSEFCAECTEWYAQVYSRLRSYLKEHPNSTLWDVHKALNIPLSVLQQVLKDETSNQR